MYLTYENSDYYSDKNQLYKCYIKTQRWKLITLLLITFLLITFITLWSGVIKTPVKTPHTADHLLNNLKYIVNNNLTCVTEPRKLYFIILIHSRPENFNQRELIRETWGSVTSLNGTWAVKTMFLLGETDSKVKTFKIAQESEIYGDIIQGNFKDTYKNLTYKHVMAYKWLLSFCNEAEFLLKADDDAFIDVYQLFSLLRRLESRDIHNSLVCNVSPHRTEVRRTDKWAVTTLEYESSTYPAYCSGLAYVASPNVINDLLSVLPYGRFLWVDDVYMTGVLAELSNTRHFYLNLRYSYDSDNVMKWLAHSSHLPPPYIIYHTNPQTPNYNTLIKTAWENVLLTSKSILQEKLH